MFAQLFQRGRHDRDAAVVGVVAALGMPASLPVVAGEVGAPGHLVLGGALTDLVEDEQERRPHPLVLITSGCGPAGAPQRLLDAVGVLLLLMEEPGVLVELRGDEDGFLGAVVDLDEEQRHPVLRGDEDNVGLGFVLARRVSHAGDRQRDLGPVDGFWAHVGAG
ncbi:hypothetical protein ACWDY4_46460 [Streptomyces olivaceoviridis]